MRGVPKGLELVGSLRVLDRVAAALAQVTDTLILAANDPLASTWLPGITVVCDEHPGAGGLAGIEAALGASKGRDAVVVAWDMPFVTAALLQALVDAGDAHDADAVLPESESPYGFEPFCAYYSARLREPLSAFFAAGGGAARDFLHGLPRLRLLSTAEVARLGDPSRLFLSINTPQDLDRARAMVTPTK